jgi:hypothetical protein
MTPIARMPFISNISFFMIVPSTMHDDRFVFREAAVNNLSFSFFGHTKLESTVRYLGTEVDNATEQIEPLSARAAVSVMRNRGLPARSSCSTPEF